MWVAIASAGMEVGSIADDKFLFSSRDPTRRAANIDTSYGAHKAVLFSYSTFCSIAREIRNSDGMPSFGFRIIPDNSSRVTHCEVRDVLGYWYSTVPVSRICNSDGFLAFKKTVSVSRKNF
jgi:hypothetical protein